MSWTFDRAPFLIAGPCMVEGDELMLRVGEALAALSARRRMPMSCARTITSSCGSITATSAAVRSPGEAAPRTRSTSPRSS